MILKIQIEDKKGFQWRTHIFSTNFTSVYKIGTGMFCIYKNTKLNCIRFKVFVLFFSLVISTVFRIFTDSLMDCLMGNVNMKQYQ